MGVRSSAYWNAYSAGGIHRWNPPRGLSAILLLELFASKVHRVLDSPAHTERLHTLQRFFRCIVEMCDRPAQARNRNFLMEFLEQREQLVHGRLAAPVHGQGYSLFRSPLDDLVIAILLCFR